MLPIVPPVTKIDRYALVSRHNVEIRAFDANAPIQVGNGEFAFGMDATGLQSFVPFNTMSQWGWHSSPLPEGVKVSDYQWQLRPTHGREVPYPLPDPAHSAISAWLAGNEHRINLGRIGFLFTKQDGSQATEKDLTDVDQKLDLWSGTVTSRYEIDHVPVTVVTACAPNEDEVAVQVQSPLIRQGRLSVFLDAPADDTRQFNNFVGTWGEPQGFTLLQPQGPQAAEFVHSMPGTGADTYARLQWSAGTLLKPSKTGPELKIEKAIWAAGDHQIDATDTLRKKMRGSGLVITATNENLGGDPQIGVAKHLHLEYSLDGRDKSQDFNENDDVVIDGNESLRRYRLQPAPNQDSFDFTCGFSPKPFQKEIDNAPKAINDSKKSWRDYWTNGGAIDLSGSTDPRWKELERRIVLSQYLMRVNEFGSNPPQESGLVNNGWFGRFHLEMTWWHAAHWALWNQPQQIQRTREFYQRLLPIAESAAKKQGYQGARWPKCIGPQGREWPHDIHSFLIWQQPHPIMFAELDYRAHPNPETLKGWWPIVKATANFLSSYAYLSPDSQKYELGPPLQVVSENAPEYTAHNPTFELGYWRYGLRTALDWQKRLHQSPDPTWSRVLANLAPLPKQDDTYVLYEGVPDFWKNYNFEHPALIGTYGMLPGDGVDQETFKTTLDRIGQVWNFDRTWGWDYPMLAMAAARNGEPGKAVDYLLQNSPNFQFDERGLATGGPFPYFPSNGALLYAAAMMAAGWDGSQGHAPGFPKDGSWTVRYENLLRAP